MLAGRSFVLDAAEAAEIRDRDGRAAKKVIRPFLGGGDLARRMRRRFVVDFFGFDEDEARRAAPHAYQHLLAHVKPERLRARDAAFREKWWLFGRPRPDLRRGLHGLRRYIGTTETARRRVFQFIDASNLPDHMIIAVATDDPFHLAILRQGGRSEWKISPESSAVSLLGASTASARRLRR